MLQDPGGLAGGDALAGAAGDQVAEHRVQPAHDLVAAISLSGVYVVGQDIKSGTWHTNGDGGGGIMPDECYFATLNSSNTEDIADNNNFDGAETVDVSGAYAFEISGPRTWYYAG